MIKTVLEEIRQIKDYNRTILNMCRIDEDGAKSIFLTEVMKDLKIDFIIDVIEAEVISKDVYFDPIDDKEIIYLTVK